MAQNYQIGLGGLDLARDQENYQDPYFSRNLLEQILPTLKLKTNPTELFYLIEDLCVHIVQQLSRDGLQSTEKQKRLNQEFYVLTMINALFGNPNIHLVQLHPKFEGIKNYNSAKLTFGLNGNKEFEDGHTLLVEKKRRNALTEVLRFICQ